MHGPVGMFGLRNEMNAPITPDATPKPTAKSSMRCMRSVSRYAAAAGVISIADTSTTPTACSAITTANATSSINPW